MPSLESHLQNNNIMEEINRFLEVVGYVVVSMAAIFLLFKLSNAAISFSDYTMDKRMEHTNVFNHEGVERPSSLTQSEVWYEILSSDNEITIRLDGTDLTPEIINMLKQHIKGPKDIDLTGNTYKREYVSSTDNGIAKIIYTKQN